MYINDHRPRTRKRLYKGGRGIAGLGASASDCGANQVFYPQLNFLGVTGQCVDRSYIDGSGNINIPGVGTWTAAQAGAPSTGSGTDVSSVVGSVAGLVGKLFGQQPAYPYPVAPAAGIDTTTLLIVGGLGLGLILVMSRRGGD